MVTIAKVNISQLDIFKVLADLILEVLGINLRVSLGFEMKLTFPVTCLKTKTGTIERSYSHHDAVGAQYVGIPSVEGDWKCLLEGLDDQVELLLGLLTSRDHLHSHMDLAFPERFKDLPKVAGPQLLTECELLPWPLPVIPVGQGLSFVLERQKGQ